MVFHGLVPFDQSSLLSLLNHIPRSPVHPETCADLPCVSSFMLLMKGVCALLCTTQFQLWTTHSRSQGSRMSDAVESKLDAIALVTSSRRDFRTKLRLSLVFVRMKCSPQLCEALVKSNERKLLPILQGSYDVWEDLLSCTSETKRCLNKS